MDKKKHLQNFVNWSKKNQFYLSDLFPSIHKNEAVHIDLSLNNTTVKTEAEFNNPHYFSKQIHKIEQKNPTKIIAGGYLEKRALYTSNLYNTTSSTEKRNTHLGIDFWLPTNTAVHAILEGKIVCAVHQTDLKGYGGFVILKHELHDIEFYTLYGHLSKNSIADFKIGDFIKQHEKIGDLGNYEENGEWVPHLHFQVMLTLLNFKNDFPGVVLESEIEYWKTICPDPNLLFKLKSL